MFDLSQIHVVELEILEEVDKFCRENHIHYSLYCGTMLGAVRHNGFIPWDDDIDICMLREDYNKFIKLWLASNNQNYILQNKEVDNRFSQSFTKIRKNHTTFLQGGEENAKYHTGIFIDILPLDRIPKKKWEKLLYKWNLMNYLLYTREFVSSKSNVIVSSFSRFLLCIHQGEVRKRKRAHFYNNIIKYNNDISLNLVSANSLDGLNHEMPATLPNKYQRVTFENRKFDCYEDTNGLLSAWYGNYMQLPPEEQRVWKHKPIKVSFDKNLDEL